MKPVVRSGDVIEFELEGEDTSALVLLASDGAAILDLCDGSMPLAVLVEDLAELRVFSGDEASEVGAA